MFDFFTKVPEISVTELRKKLLTEKIKLIDVREPYEYNTGHIKQAKNIPLTHISEFKDDPKQTIYVICQSGHRSKRATQFLNRKGYKAISVENGMNGWHGKTIQ